MSYGPKTYRTNGGDKYVIASGGEIEVESGGVITAAGTLQSAATSHLNLITQAADKNVRVNVKTFTSDASIVGLMVKPAAGVALTNRIAGIEVSPRVNDTFAGTGIVGVLCEAWKRGTGAAGNISGVMAVYEGKLITDSGYSGTVTGPAAVLRAINSLHGTVTNGPAVIYAHNHEGNVAWDSLVYGTEALGTHSLTSASDKTANAKSGTLKVRFGGNVYHIQLYAN